MANQGTQDTQDTSNQQNAFQIDAFIPLMDRKIKGTGDIYPSGPSYILITPYPEIKKSSICRSRRDWMSESL
jgi:hypothetical protein